ncbi:hypothetical protein BDP81DRAFT_125876 [Colletotrichum phormii]|uniref:Uncharacterized protein n=1 Tax=Colletotrichum phormii TaxID=359342 RepID=A0AAJ0A1V5_9PEZI|nr:uncharacterized protein BDP81DRAFT_125876 [Colletotrichum phormii]KAK1640998.1 hypothetical protein BDP81DRAFT_125876 [Colletotrichum phormii]
MGPTLGLRASDYLLTPLIRPQQNSRSTQGTVSLKTVDNFLDPAQKGGSPVDSPKFRSRHMPRLASPRQQTLTGRAMEALGPPLTRLRGESVLNYPRLFWNFYRREFHPAPRMLKVMEPVSGALPYGQSTTQHHNIADTSERRADVDTKGHGISTPWGQRRAL